MAAAGGRPGGAAPLAGIHLGPAAGWGAVHHSQVPLAVAILCCLLAGDHFGCHLEQQQGVNLVHIVGISSRRWSVVQVSVLPQASRFNPGCCVGNLIPWAAAPIGPAHTGMSTPIVEAITPSWPVPDPGPGTLRDVRVEVAGLSCLREKGPSLIRLMALNNWLDKYPKLEDAKYFRQGFRWGFRIPFEGPWDPFCLAI